MYTHASVLSYSHFLLLSHLPDVTGVVPTRNNSHKSPMVTQIHFVRFHWRRCFNKTRRGPIIQLGDLSLHSRMIHVHTRTKILYFYQTAQKREWSFHAILHFIQKGLSDRLSLLFLSRVVCDDILGFFDKNDWQAM